MLTLRKSRKFSFILHSGVEIFPIEMENRKTGVVAFRVSKGGKGGNTVAASEQVNEAQMVQRVLEEGYAVRCSSENGSVQGLYRHGHRAVREVRRM